MPVWQNEITGIRDHDLCFHLGRLPLGLRGSGSLQPTQIGNAADSVLLVRLNHTQYVFNELHYLNRAKIHSERSHVRKYVIACLFWTREGTTPSMAACLLDVVRCEGRYRRGGLRRILAVGVGLRNLGVVEHGPFCLA